MVEANLAEIRALRTQQRQRERGESLANECQALSRSCAVLQSEIRKTGDDADKAVRNLPPERRLELLLTMVRDLSPDHRAAVRVYLDELGLGLM
jgi:DNA-directed RNA polymerase specialized sigma24 family protein